MKRAESGTEEWIPEGAPEVLSPPTRKARKATNRNGKAKHSRPKRQPAPPPPAPKQKAAPPAPAPTQKANDGPSTNTSEWVAVSEGEPQGSIRVTNANANANNASDRRPRRQSGGIGGRRISPGARSLKRDLATQQAEIERLEKKVKKQAKAQRDHAAALKRIEKQLNGQPAAAAERKEKQGSKAAQKPSAPARKTAKGGPVERRLEDLEQKLDDATEQLERAEAAAKTYAGPPRSKAKTRAPKPAQLPKGKLDVNKLSFEEFRALGLSVTQSARMVALRDMDDGFSEIDDLDRVVGLPQELRQDLKRRLVVR